MIKINNQIYLAGPFFNETELERIHFLEDYLEDDLGLNVFSPLRDGGKLDPHDVDERWQIFKNNVVNIENNEVVVAVLDGFDTGTIWEIGHAMTNGMTVIGLTFEKESYDKVFEKFSNIMTHPNFLLLRMDNLEDNSRLLTLEKLIRDSLSGQSYLKVAMIFPKENNHYDEFTADELHNRVSDNVDKPVIMNFYSTEDNIDYQVLEDSDVVVMVIDDRHPVVSYYWGRLFEQFRNNKVNIVSYTEEDYGVNVMLQCSVNRHCIGMDKLVEAVVNYKDLDDMRMDGLEDIKAY